MSELVKDINAAQFPAEVIKSTTPVLVDFWAPWCGPCRAMGPVLDQLSQEYAGRVKVVKVNIDENQDLANEYNVMSIPLLLLFDGGEPRVEMLGARPRDMVAKQLDQHLSTATR